MSKFIDKKENFMFTYGDGVSNVNIKKLIKFHKKNKKMITVTAVRPPARFGEITIKNKRVDTFKEKPQVKEGWINGGFFVANHEFFKFIKNDRTILENEPLEKATKVNQLYAYKHYGFWKCMDTLRDKEVLEKILKKKKIFIEKKRILITGATGFIGYYLAKKCLSKGWAVVSFSKNIPKKIRYLKNVKYFKGNLSTKKRFKSSYTKF